MTRYCCEITPNYIGINRVASCCLYTVCVEQKESIKAYVTERHHFFVYEHGWIDDYSMECLERRFLIYQHEHGNSFVEGLMDEIRALPKQPPEQYKHKFDGTATYVKNAKAKTKH